jgi:tRNA dimethylallyltransferase
VKLLSASAIKNKVIAIVGPTASGKSALAVLLARKLNGEIISADSRQVYRSLNIGTNKITKKEMHGIRHFLLDVADPKKPYTAYRYAKDASRAIQEIIKRGKIPIICGGTGFYIDAVLYGSPFPRIPPNPSFRKMMERRSTEALFAELKKVDPRRAATIDPKNRRRLIRALEIIAATGAPVAPQKKEPKYEALKIGIKVEMKELERRIRLRLKREFRRGLIEEVKRLKRRGLSWKRLYELGLEYRFVARFLQGEIKSKTELEKLLAYAIIGYAKRQIRWFKRDKDIIWSSDKRKLIAAARKFIGA